jgi:hypothetical protein
MKQLKLCDNSFKDTMIFTKQVISIEISNQPTFSTKMEFICMEISDSLSPSQIYLLIKIIMWAHPSICPLKLSKKIYIVLAVMFGPLELSFINF